MTNKIRPIIMTDQEWESTRKAGIRNGFRSRSEYIRWLLRTSNRSKTHAKKNIFK